MAPTTLPRFARRSAAAAVAALLVAAPFAERSDAATTNKTTARTTARSAAAPVPNAATGSGARIAGAGLVGWDRIADGERPLAGDAVVADARALSLIVRRAPGLDAGMLRFDAGRTVAGSISLLALGGHDGWVRVMLPVRPNGTVGWVRSDEVSLRRTTLRIVIELSTNTMTVEDRGLVLAKSKVAAGTGGTPTPLGQFFVKELVPQANPKGALGPYAFGLSAYSEVLMSFAGGSGVVAIHGTNAPGRLGGNVSHGCIRTDNATITRMAGGLVPLGTPVEIVQRRADLPMVRQTSAWITGVGLPANGMAQPVNTAPVTVPVVTSYGTVPPVAPPPAAPSGPGGAIALAPNTTVAR